MTDETTDAVDHFCGLVQDVVRLVRRSALTGHERRTLLDALGHGVCVPHERLAEVLAREAEAQRQHDVWRNDVEGQLRRAERERDALKDTPPHRRHPCPRRPAAQHRAGALVMGQADVAEGIRSIAAERRRQVEKGYTPEHDDEHIGDLALAAHCYLDAGLAAMACGDASTTEVPADWPWEPSAWRPSDDPVRNFAKAGALVAAEIDRLGRGRS